MSFKNEEFNKLSLKSQMKYKTTKGCSINARRNDTYDKNMTTEMKQGTRFRKDYHWKRHSNLLTYLKK